MSSGTRPQLIPAVAERPYHILEWRVWRFPEGQVSVTLCSRCVRYTQYVHHAYTGGYTFEMEVHICAIIIRYSWWSCMHVCIIYTSMDHLYSGAWISIRKSDSAGKKFMQCWMIKNEKKKNHPLLTLWKLTHAWLEKTPHLWLIPCMWERNPRFRLENTLTIPILHAYRRIEKHTRFKAIVTSRGFQHALWKFNSTVVLKPD